MAEPQPHIHPEGLGDLALALALATVLVATLWILHAASALTKGLTMNTFLAIALAAIRHALTLGGGALATAGVLTDVQSDQLVGIGMAFVAFGWSVLQKHAVGKKLAALLDQ